MVSNSSKIKIGNANYKNNNVKAIKTGVNL